jgi:ABC-type sulfate/molybdate transport systems ATPase subunit
VGDAVADALVAGLKAEIAGCGRPGHAARATWARWSRARTGEGARLRGPGTVHGIVGENGAGKSTLMSILYGFYQADAGQIEIDGQPVQITGSHEAIALGIGMVHQHFMLVDTLSALDNVMLGAEPAGAAQGARPGAHKLTR